MPVEVSVPDLIRLKLVTAEEASSELRNAVKRLAAAGIIRRPKTNALIYILRQKKNRDCLFLDAKRRCTVYERRPEICRQFPKIGPRPGHCPYREMGTK